MVLSGFLSRFLQGYVWGSGKCKYTLLLPPPLHPSQFELQKLCVLCWRELSTAATIIWADSTPPSANRSPSGQSPKLPHPAGSFRKQGSGWIPVRGLNREAEEWAESRGWGGQERRL